MAAVYTKKANRKKLAGDAARSIAVPPAQAGGTLSGENSDKSVPSDGDWRSHGESNPGFSLERAAS